jgi:hypothetical protein
MEDGGNSSLIGVRIRHSHAPLLFCRSDQLTRLQPAVALSASTLSRRSGPATADLKAYISYACSTPPTLEGLTYAFLTPESRPHHAQLTLHWQTRSLSIG